MSEPSHAVFLSYASQDAQAAQRICEALRAAGVEVWFDQSELRGGDAWDTAIRKQIKSCALFIPIISRNAHARGEGYFRLEWKLAVDRSHLIASDLPFLIPVVIDDTSDTDDRIPERFREIQWTRLLNGETPAAFAERVQRLLSPGEASTRVRGPVSAQSGAVGIVRERAQAARLPRSRRYRAMGISGLVLAILAGGYAWLAHRAAPDVRVPQITAGETDPKSIAVLPFVDMSASKDQGYMSDGLAEELLNLLAKIPDLRVTSRSSAFSFKDKNLDIPEIARRLHVAHILEGSVRKSGDRLRIDAQLIDARSDTSMWSETYQRPLDDIFAVQDEIAVAVVGQLKIALLDAPPKAKVVDTRAYALFLQARPLARLHSAEGYEQSNALYKQALAIDANYAPAWDGLAYNYRRQANNGMRPLEEGYQLAREALGKALAIDPDYAPSTAALGRIALDHDGDLAAAARYLERALTLAPSDPDIVYTAARVAEGLGRLGQSMQLDEFALRHDPLNPTLQNIIGIDYRYAGRLDESIEAFRKVLQLSPGNISAHYQMGVSMLLKRDYVAALATMQQEPSEGWRTLGLPMAYHALGDKQKYQAAVDKMIEVDEKKWPASIASVFAFTGEIDRAFEWLEKAAASHDPTLASIAVEPLCANLQRDPRWLTFLRKVGRSAEQLDPIRLDVKVPPT